MSTQTRTEPKKKAPRTTSRGGALPLDHAPVQTVEFDFMAIEAATDTPPPLADCDLGTVLRGTVDWLATGDRSEFNKAAAVNRLIALAWYLQLPCFNGIDNISELAARFKLTAEGLNKYIRSLNRRFGVYAPGQKHSISRRDKRERISDGSVPIRGDSDMRN